LSIPSKQKGPTTSERKQSKAKKGKEVRRDEKIEAFFDLRMSSLVQGQC